MKRLYDLEFNQDNCSNISFYILQENIFIICRITDLNVNMLHFSVTLGLCLRMTLTWRRYCICKSFPGKLPLMSLMPSIICMGSRGAGSKYYLVLEDYVSTKNGNVSP